MWHATLARHRRDFEPLQTWSYRNVGFQDYHAYVPVPTHLKFIALRYIYRSQWRRRTPERRFLPLGDQRNVVLATLSPLVPALSHPWNSAQVSLHIQALSSACIVIHIISIESHCSHWSGCFLCAVRDCAIGRARRSTSGCTAVASWDIIRCSKVPN